MGIDWTNLTFGGLGFEGIRNLANMRFNVAKGRYETFDFSAAKSFHRQFLMTTLLKYLTHGESEGYVAALGYMLDGSIEYAERVMDGSSLGRSGVYDAEFYKTCNYINANSNIECVSSLILTHQPEGLFLYQEIPSEDRKVRRFRVIHESYRDDRLDEKEQKALLAIRKKAIVKACMGYLSDLRGVEELSDREREEVLAILELIGVLSPNTLGSLPAKKGKGRKRKTDGKKILKFREDPPKNP